MSTEDAVVKIKLRICAATALERQLIIAATVDVIKDHLMRAPLRASPDVGDVDGVRKPPT